MVLLAPQVRRLRARAALQRRDLSQAEADLAAALLAAPGDVPCLMLQAEVPDERESIRYEIGLSNCTVTSGCTLPAALANQRLLHSAGEARKVVLTRPTESSTIALLLRHCHAFNRCCRRAVAIRMQC